MKHIKQRKNECYLTTLAMLTGKSVDEILASAQVMSPYTHSWDSFTSFDPMSDIKIVYKALARKYAPWLASQIDFPNSRDIYKPGFFDISSDDYIDLTEEGRGAILLVATNPFCAHICAFENGIIYDSALAEPMDA